MSPPPPMPQLPEANIGKSFLETASDGYKFLGERFAPWIKAQIGFDVSPREVSKYLFYASLVGFFFQLCVWPSFIGLVYDVVVWGVVAAAIPWAIGSYFDSISRKEDEAVTKWLERLFVTESKRVSFAFKPLSAARPFLLQFTFRVLLDRPTGENLINLRVRARNNSGPAKEVEEIERRLYQMIDAFASNLPPKVLQCADAAFWSEVECRLNQLLSPRIEDEFGCRIVVSDLKREKNPLEDELDRMVDPSLKLRIESHLALLGDADEFWMKLY